MSVPANLQCSVCSLPILPRKHYFTCCLCNSSVHRVGCATTVNPAEYSRIKKRDDWKCDSCSTTSTHPSAVVNSTSCNRTLALASSTSHFLWSPSRRSSSLPASASSSSPAAASSSSRAPASSSSPSPVASPSSLTLPFVSSSLPFAEYDEISEVTEPGCLSPMDIKNKVLNCNSLKHSIDITFGKGLIIGQVNINGIKSKFDELRDLLINFNFLFLGVTETKLSVDDTFTSLSLSNYILVRLDRVRSGGGVLFYIHTSASYEILEFKIEFPEDTEIVLVKVTPKGIKPILIVLVYNNPKNSISKFISAFQLLLAYVDSFQLEYVCLGDFNIDLLSVDSNVSQLFCMRREFGLKQMILNPTRRVVTRRGVSETLIDHLYVSRPELYPVSGQFPFAGSDHDFIFLTRKVNKIKNPPILVSYRSYLKANWEQIFLKFNLLDFSFLSVSEPESGLCTFNSQCISFLDSFAPIRRKMVRDTRNPWFNGDIFLLIKERNKFERLKSKVKSLKANLDFRRARNKVNIAINFAKKKYFNFKFLYSFKNQSVWDIVNRLTGYRKKTNNKINALFSNSKVAITSDVGIFDTFADSFIVKSNGDADIALVERINSYCDLANNTNIPCNFNPTEKEVSEAISKLKSKSSCSDKCVPSKFIKNLSCLFIHPLFLLFSQIFSLCCVPKEFRTALVTPLYKGSGPRNIANSYRPISVLSPITKIFESVLFAKIRILIEPLLCLQQHGFRPGYSCHTALFNFTQEVFKAIDIRNGRVGAVFVDLRKAFNSVNHPILLSKLIDIFKLDPHYIKLLRSYLGDRKFIMKNGDKLSDPYAEDGAVPQGSTLGPLLFSAFINDIGRVLDLPFLLYADDLVFYATGVDPEVIVKRLQSNLERLNSWCLENKLTINIEKTEFMWFHKAHDTKFGLVPRLLLNGLEIARVFKFKYLGLILDPSLSFKIHFARVKSKVSSCIGKLYGVRKFLPLKVNQMLVNAYVQSAYDYCIDIWCVQSRLELMPLQNIVNRYLYSSVYKALFRKMSRQMRFRRSRRRRKLNYFSFNQLDMNDLMCNFNLLTVEERSSWTRAKNILSFLKSPVEEFRSVFKFSENARTSRTLPLLQIEGCNSETFRKSVKFKSCKLWNSLPKDMNIYSDKESDGFIVKSEFKEKLYDYFTSIRNSIWLSFQD